MKILHVCLTLSDTLGGPPRAMATLARAQAARGDEVCVLPGVRGLGQPTLPAGRSGTLEVLPPPALGQLKWFSPRLKRELRRAARGRDIVHIHGTWRYYVIGAAAVARAYGIPFIVQPTGNLGQVCYRHKSYLKVPYFELVERRILNRAAALHCTSLKEQRELAPVGLRARMFVAPEPVELDSAEKAANHAADRNPSPGPSPLAAPDGLILYLGRVSFIKRIDVLVEAFARLAPEFPGWGLVLAGPHEDADIVSKLESRVTAAGLGQRVSLPGMVRGAAKTELLARAAIFAQPSSHENFGISLAEALLLGLPSIVSRHVGLADDIEAARAGIVCDNRVEPFEAALRQMMTDTGLRACYSTAARQLARRFAPAAVAELLDAEYKRCLAG